MRYSGLVIILFFSILAVDAQVRNAPTPTPTPISPIRRDEQQNISRRSENLRLTENLPVQPVNANNKIFREKIRPIYRKPNKKERKMLAPDAGLEKQYAAFLKDKRTGLSKLIADQGCDKEIGVVVSTPHCLKYTLPGAGASYSFRYDNYRIRYLSDLNFTGQNFQTVGVLTHGILADIGDVPLAEVGLETKGVSYLLGITPAENFTEARDLIAKLEKGIENEGIVYKNNQPVREDTTYILRSIAYRGNSLRSIEGIVYNELEFDKRRDVTVAFRVVRRDPEEGSATILWKELQSKKSPKIEADE